MGRPMGTKGEGEREREGEGGKGVERDGGGQTKKETSMVVSVGP